MSLFLRYSPPQDGYFHRFRIEIRAVSMERPYVSFEQRRRLTDSIEDWCLNNLETRWKLTYDYLWRVSSFDLADSKDVIAFRLRWSDIIEING